MAIVQNPITGRTKKKFGNAVFSKQFGKNTLRTLPIEVKNPKTPAQVKQRSAFKAALFVVREFLPAVRIGWKGRAIHKSAFAMCMSDTLMNAMKTVGGVTSVDVNKFKVSDGNLDSFNEESWSRPAPNKINVIWDPTEFLPNSAGTDIIHICACNEDMNIVQLYLNAAVRSDGTATITLGHPLAGTLNVYCLAFTQSVRFDSRNNLVGHTQYSGALQP
jgi:hypothetical protein